MVQQLFFRPWSRCSFRVTGIAVRHNRFNPNDFKGPPLSGAKRNALENMRRVEADNLAVELAEESMIAKPPSDALIVRRHNAPPEHEGTLLPSGGLYLGHPHNFTPLRPIPHGFNAVDRAVREIAWESRFDLLKRRIVPKYASECPGTPRREYQVGMVNGIRVRPIFNPYVRLNSKRKWPLNTWPSRNWKTWNPLRCHIRGSRRRYRVPEDIMPYKDELGEWHPPRVSGRYKADIEKQYWMNGLEWVWSNDYYQGKLHFMDREPLGPKRWYKKEYRKAQIREAMRRMDTLVDEYRREKREAKRLSWIETMALEFAGEQLAAPFVRRRRLPKM